MGYYQGYSLKGHIHPCALALWDFFSSARLILLLASKFLYVGDPHIVWLSVGL